MPAGDLKGNSFIVSVTTKGMVKKTAMVEYSHPRSGGIIAGKLKSEDHILDVQMTDGDCGIVLLTREGRSIRFSESEISVVGRASLGVKGIGLKSGDSVVSMLVVRREGTVLCVAQDGSGKRINLGELPLRKRGGLGIAVLDREEGLLVSAMEVADGDRLSAVTNDGKDYIINIEDVPIQKRSEGARPLMNVVSDSEVTEVVFEHVGTREAVEEEAVEEEQMNLLD